MDKMADKAKKLAEEEVSPVPAAMIAQVERGGAPGSEEEVNPTFLKMESSISQPTPQGNIQSRSNHQVVRCEISKTHHQEVRVLMY